MRSTQYRSQQEIPDQTSQNGQAKRWNCEPHSFLHTTTFILYNNSCLLYTSDAADEV